MRPLTQRRSVAAGMATVLALSAATAVSADEDTLCDALTLKEVSSIVDLTWELRFEDALGCGYGAPADHPFAQSINVQFADDWATFDELVAEEGARELSVGDHAGVFAGGMLWVQAEDALIQISGGFSDPDVQSRVDIEAFLVDAALLTVDDLPERPPDEDPTAQAEAAGLPQVPGIAWKIYGDLRGAEVQEAISPAEFAVFEPLLEEVGGDIDQITMLTADMLDDETNAKIGGYSRVTVSGVDREAMRSSVLPTFQVMLGPDVALEDVSIGGESVTSLAMPDGSSGWLYFAGDTLHTLQAPEDIVAVILGELS